MKTNPAIADFPAAMVAASEAALDAGMFSNTDFDAFVLRHMGGFGCEGVLMEIAELNAQASDYFALQRALHARLEPRVISAPRGHYAVIKIVRASASPFYKTIVSDGYGDGVATGGAYDSYSIMPDEGTVLERMIRYEIYLCRKAIEQERHRQADCESLALRGFHVGMKFGSIEVGGEKFSSAIVSKIHQDNGSVTLFLVRRGSRRRWETTLSANTLANKLKTVAGQPAEAASASTLSVEDSGQRLLFA